MKFETPNFQTPNNERSESTSETLIPQDPELDREQIIFAEEVSIATNEMEFHLEHSVESEPISKGRSRQSPFGRWLRGTLAAGLLVGGMAANANADADGNIDLAKDLAQKGEHVVEVSSGSGQKEKTLSPEAERQVLLEKTGYDIEGIAEKAGFKATLDVENGAGPYIVHIGQLHYSKVIERGSAKEQVEQLQRTISLQKNIEQILLAFFSQGGNTITNVFGEGILTNSQEHAYYAACRETLSKILPGKGCFLKVLGSYKSMAYVGNDDSSGPKIALTYLYREKLNELEQYYISHPDEQNLLEKKSDTPKDAPKKELTPEEEFERDQKEVAEAEAKIFEKLGEGIAEVFSDIPKHLEFTDMNQELAFVREQITNTFDVYGKDEIYLAGAVNKLAVQGKIRMVGSETKAANEAASVALDNLIKAADHYATMQKTGELAKLSEAEQKKIIVELTELHVQYKKKICVDRENLAVEIIGQNDATSGVKIVPLVYGVDHQFKRSVLEYDQKNPNKKMGLIELVPKE